MSFALLFDEFLIFGDFSTEGLDWDVFLQEFIGEPVDFFFDVKSVFLTVGHDALSTWFLKLLSSGHLTDFLFGWELKLEKFVFKEIILGNEHFEIRAVFTAVLFAD